VNQHPSLEVVPFSIDKFIDLLARKASFSVSSFKTGIRGVYFAEYFKELEPKTIVVENFYVDQHYLDDYAGYYVRCFRDSGKECSRLHFFSNRFTKGGLQKVLKGLSTDVEYRENYLGFIVVKPLPHTVIGRTCPVP
jgi:hypothetical protein